MEEEKSLKFLHGLNHEYDVFRVQILGKENLPLVSKIFFIVKGEKTGRDVMLYRFVYVLNVLCV